MNTALKTLISSYKYAIVFQVSLVINTALDECTVITGTNPAAARRPSVIERRARHASRDFTVYRNRLQIDHPAHISAFKFKPFVADEIWYSTQTGSAGSLSWFRNRVSAGIIKQFNERLTAEFFYVYQQDGVSRPGNVHAIGTLLKVFL